MAIHIPVREFVVAAPVTTALEIALETALETVLGAVARTATRYCAAKG